MPLRRDSESEHCYFYLYDTLHQDNKDTTDTELLDRDQGSNVMQLICWQAFTSPLTVAFQYNKYFCL